MTRREFCAALAMAGAQRIFNGREALPGSLVAGAAVWLLASQYSGFGSGPELRGQLFVQNLATLRIKKFYPRFSKQTR